MAGTALQRYQDRAAVVVAEMSAMSEKLETEGRTAFTEAEEAEYEALAADADAAQAGIEREKKLLDRQKKLAVVVQTGDVDPIGTAEESAIAKGKSLAKKSGASIKFGSLTTFNHLGVVQRATGLSRPEMEERGYAAGQWLLSIVHPEQHRREEATLWCRDNGIAYLAQAGNVNSAGGVLVPEVLSDMIIILREQYGVYRRFAQKWTMTSDTLTIPRRTAGLTTYYVSDGVATTDSQVAFDGVTLSAKELATLVKYPIALADDAVINLADFLTGEIAWAFALEEDTAGFTSTGGSAHGGIRGLTTIITDANHGNSTTTNGATAGGLQIAAAGGNGLGNMVLADYEKTVGLLPQYASVGNPCWFMSRAAYAAGPQRLMDAGGGNTNETLSTGGGATLQGTDGFGRPYRSFLGYPVVITQVMYSTLGTQASQIAALFGDLSMAGAIGVRKDISINASRDRYFEVRQIGLMGVQRYDIVNHDLGNTTTPGPIVALQTSAS